MASEQTRIGRFEILRLLGTGAQSAVYLAHDPHLEREVAIKTLHFSEKAPEQNQFLLAEARTVSKLRHPNIVPIFEAGEQAGDPYLVFEYVEGKTLADIIRAEGALSPHKAAKWMLPVLDAIAHAHQAGTIHRDLKPSNILVDLSGTPRVMDFGIALRNNGRAEAGGALMGTPAYMAPEYVRNNHASPQMDVYASGLVLFEMLLGRRAIPPDSVTRVLERVASQPVAIPPDAGLPAALLDILAKALAPDPVMRFRTVLELKEALDAYVNPVTEPAPVPEDELAHHSTLEFLLRRMRHMSDFPALSTAVSAINRLASSDRENVGTLSNSILKDFALTNKILRVVNSPFYRTVSGGGNISTVSRAIVVLGFQTIRSIAISLLLFEHLQNKTHAAALKEEFLQANLRGMLARVLVERASGLDPEEVFICALFHNLGRLLAQYYFPEEADAIQRLMEHESLSEEAASARVLGVSFADLGIGIARNWGFPDSLIFSMRRLPAGHIPLPSTREDRLRVLSVFANEACGILDRHPPERHARELSRLRARFEDALNMNQRHLVDSVERSLKDLAGFARSIGLTLPKTLLGTADDDEAAASGPGPEPGTGELVDATQVFAAMPDPAADATTTTLPVAAESPAAAPVEVGVPPAPDAQSVLAAGIQDISSALVDGFALNDLLQIIVETMYRALCFKRVLMCIRDGRNNAMCARFGFGEDSEQVVKAFRFKIGATSDIFNLVLAKGQDLLISDVLDAKIVNRVPLWYRKAVSARTFLLFPLLIKNIPVALIYADKEQAGDIIVSDKELSLLRTLRNQAVLAIRQAGS